MLYMIKTTSKTVKSNPQRFVSNSRRETKENDQYQ